LHLTAFSLTDINKDQLTAMFSQVMQSIYTSSGSDPIKLKQFARHLVRETKNLNTQSGFNQFRVELKLN
jgi:hypothetical protein